MKRQSVGRIVVHIMDEERGLKSFKLLITSVCHLLEQNKDQTNVQRQKKILTTMLLIFYECIPCTLNYP